MAWLPNYWGLHQFINPAGWNKHLMTPEKLYPTVFKVKKYSNLKLKATINHYLILIHLCLLPWFSKGLIPSVGSNYFKLYHY